MSMERVFEQKHKFYAKNVPLEANIHSAAGDIYETKRSRDQNYIT